MKKFRPFPLISHNSDSQTRKQNGDASSRLCRRVFPGDVLRRRHEKIASRMKTARCSP